MGVKDSFSDTDPPGYRVDLLDDGQIHVTGHGRDEMHPGRDIASAKDWFDMYANDIHIPLPEKAQSFIDTAKAAESALLDALYATTYDPGGDDEHLANFGGKVAEALIATAEVGAPYGLGAELIGVATDITLHLLLPKPTEAGVLKTTWDNLDRGAGGFNAYAHDAFLYRAVPREAIEQLPTFIEHAARVGAATRALFE
jgi:hypothetical protein